MKKSLAIGVMATLIGGLLVGNVAANANESRSDEQAINNSNYNSCHSLKSRSKKARSNALVRASLCPSNYVSRTPSNSHSTRPTGDPSRPAVRGTTIRIPVVATSSQSTDQPGKKKPVTKTFPGFARGSSVMPEAMKREIFRFYLANPGYKKVSCTGYTMGPTVLPGDRALSMARAKVACSFSKQIYPGIKVKTTSGVQQTRVGDLVRRVTVKLEF